MWRLSIVFLMTFSAAAADLKPIALRAASGDADAIRTLRAAGQPGVNALLAVRGSVKNAARFDSAIDAVCRQRDCAWSALYWYTDFEAAKRAAKASGRPILSLRLLGNLDEELSCANSRYFRILLYSNREIGNYLRRHYILHWKSVRPAPLITVDFGNGRSMRRSITGNSIHYVLDGEGRPLDAIPGLYAPPQFLALLKEGAALHKTLAGSNDRDKGLERYHRNAWISAVRGGHSPFDRANEYSGTRAARLKAWTAGEIAVGKSAAEDPILVRVGFDAAARGMAEELARKLRNTVAGPSTIDDNARALIRKKRASSPDPAMRTEKALKKTLERLESALAADTKANENLRDSILHRWFSAREVKDVDSLNARVYDEVFRAPGSDAWMGLAEANTFTGIEGEGLLVTK